MPSLHTAMDLNIYSRLFERKRKKDKEGGEGDYRTDKADSKMIAFSLDSQMTLESLL